MGKIDRSIATRRQKTRSEAEELHNQIRYWRTMLSALIHRIPGHKVHIDIDELTSLEGLQLRFASNVKEKRFEFELFRQPREPE